MVLNFKLQTRPKFKFVNPNQKYSYICVNLHIYIQKHKTRKEFYALQCINE